MSRSNGSSGCCGVFRLRSEVAADDLHSGLKCLMKFKFTLICVKNAAKAITASQQPQSTAYIQSAGSRDFPDGNECGK